MKRISIKQVIICVTILSLILRLWNISYPKAYVFDEVYYVFTAKEYVANNKDAWVYWTRNNENKAYAWVNPPLPQEIIAASIKIFGDKSWAWRLPSAILGSLSIYFVFLISKKFFNEKIALLSATFFALDGLNFVQSRTAMLDIYLVFFILVSLLFTLNKKYLFSSIFLGLAIASKWSGVYLLPLILILVIKNKDYFKLPLFILIPPLAYLATYIPFFLYGYSAANYMELVKQQIYYHTRLDATHSYASPWWSWPLNLIPVWYFVDYKENTISNIFASGNPILFWFGSLSIIVAAIEAIRKKVFKLLVIIIGALLFFLPWANSPRIMFLYYFAPAVPFISIALAYQTNKLLENKKFNQLGVLITILIIIGFILIYPFLVGTYLPKNWVDLFFSFNLAKNPF